MWHFLIHKLVCMIWHSCICFSYYFLVSMCIRSNLSFVLNHYLEIYGVFHFSGIQCHIIFWWKLVIFVPLSLNLNLYPQINPWHFIYRWIPTFNPICTLLFGSAVSLRGRGQGRGQGRGLNYPPPTPLVFSRSICPIHCKLGKYLTHHKHFQNKSKRYPRSLYFFNDVIIFREI